MIIKLLIIIGIVVVGAIIFYPQNEDFFSNDIDETKEQITSFKDDAANNIEKTLGNVANKLTTSFDNTINGLFVKPN